MWWLPEAYGGSPLTVCPTSATSYEWAMDTLSYRFNFRVWKLKGMLHLQFGFVTEITVLPLEVITKH